MPIKIEQKTSLAAPAAYIQSLQSHHGLLPDIAHLLWARGLQTDEQVDRYLYPALAHLHDPMLLLEMPMAVQRIRQALQMGERMVIYGDYDVDGIVSTVMLLSYLRQCGGNAESYLPSRHTEGYGLNAAAIEQLASRGTQLIITVDNGISAVGEIALARRLGMDVVVLDHHQCPTELPVCSARINPQMGGYPFTGLCGAGVAAKLIQAMASTEALNPYWDLLALATVADIVPLLDENRVFVRQGLDKIRNNPHPGLAALLESAGVADISAVKADTLIYTAAPRLNAAGRMGDAMLGVELLMATEPDVRRSMAGQLQRANVERQQDEKDITQMALQLLIDEPQRLWHKGLLILCPDANPGVIGIVASRLTTRFYRPAVVLAQGKEESVASARSIAGVNLFQALEQCRDLFSHFGGHEQAAGFTINNRNIEQFERRFYQVLEQMTPQWDMIPVAGYDQTLELSKLNMEFAMQMERFEPVGHGNPCPVFRFEQVALDSPAPMGRGRAHLRAVCRDGGASVPLVAFGKGDLIDSVTQAQSCSLIASPSINHWNGRQTLQLMASHIIPHVQYGQEDEYKAQCAFLRQILYNYSIIRRGDGGHMRYVNETDAQALVQEQMGAQAQGVAVLCYQPADIGLLRRITPHADVRSAFKHEAEAPYHTLVFAPALEELPAGRWREVILWDGLLSEAAFDVLAARHPHTRFWLCHRLETVAWIKQWSAAFALERGDVVRVYTTLQASPTGDVPEGIACRAGVELGKTTLALAALAELSLLSLECREGSGFYAFPAECAQKRQLEQSLVYRHSGQLDILWERAMQCQKKKSLERDGSHDGFCIQDPEYTGLPPQRHTV